MRCETTSAGIAPAMMTLTQGLGRFIAEPGFDRVPDDIAPRLREAFIDTIACMLSGRDEPVTRAALSFVNHRIAPASEARLLLARQACDAPSAAFVNAVSAHALDFDDMALAGHPSVVLVPALLASGAAVGASGGQLLRAYLVGYEVWAELASRESDAWHEKGWHPTGVLGTVGAAAAVAALHRMSPAASAHALGIAASLAGGLVGNFGSMTKPLHAGWAARHGIEAARLAQAGVTASADALESSTGFLHALSPAGRVRTGPVASENRSLAFRESGLSIKKYPVCYAVHRVIDGVLDLRGQHAFAIGDVASIVASVSDANARILRHHRPETAVQARFSAEFACASALLDGNVGVRELTDERVSRADVVDLMARVEVAELPAGCPIERGFALHDRVAIHLKNGTVLDSGDIRFPRGHAYWPLTDVELRTKFFGCVHAAEQPAALELIERIASMDGTDEAFDPQLGSADARPAA